MPAPLWVSLFLFEGVTVSADSGPLECEPVLGAGSAQQELVEPSALHPLPHCSPAAPPLAPLSPPSLPRPWLLLEGFFLRKHSRALEVLR